MLAHRSKAAAKAAAAKQDMFKSLMRARLPPVNFYVEQVRQQQMELVLLLVEPFLVTASIRVASTRRDLVDKDNVACSFMSLTWVDQTSGCTVLLMQTISYCNHLPHAGV